MKTKVYIAIPTTGFIRVELMFFLLNLDENYDIKIDYTNGGFIAESRNVLVERFLKSKYEWLLFIDSDQLLPFDIFEMTKNGVDICSGVAFQWKGNRMVPLVYRIEKTDFTEEYKVFNDTTEEEIVEVDGVGAGCLLIHRKVLETIKKPYFLFQYNDDGKIVLGEDFYFCLKAKKAGFKVWVDRKMVSSHFKTIDLKQVNNWKREDIWWK